MTLHQFADLQTDTTLSLSMNSELAAAMNQWRLTQTPPLDVNAAIYALLWRGLAAGTTPSEVATPAVQSGDPQTQAMIQSLRNFLASAPVRLKAQ